MSQLGDGFIYTVYAQLSRASAHMESAWSEWYEQEHFPKLLSVPGFRSADRYVHPNDPTHSFAVYGIDSPDVFTHPRYLEVTGWGPWEGHIERWTRGLYRAVSLPGSDG